MKFNKNYLSLTAWILIIEAIGAIIGSLTKSNIDNWYVMLNRSFLTPPNYYFGIAWTILYLMIAISGWLFWQLTYNHELKHVKKLFIVQMILNWSWTPIFFKYHLLGAAFICIFLIIILVTLIIIKSFKKAFLPSILLFPYLLWLIFASYLNFYIWINN